MGLEHFINIKYTGNCQNFGLEIDCTITMVSCDAPPNFIDFGHQKMPIKQFAPARATKPEVPRLL